jgi:c(7)-type cytochrome triheme protein
MKYCLAIAVTAIILTCQSAVFAVTIRDALFTTAVGKVVFSHREHIGRKGMSNNCRACHDAIFDLKKKRVNTMADMAKGKSCGACHNGSKAFGIDKCTACHPVKEITYKIKETGPTHFSHKFHVEVAGCAKCHPALYAANRPNKRTGMADMEKGASCGACHNAKQAFPLKECSKCHPAGELLFVDKEAGNVVFSHKFHTGMFSCTDCHTKLYRTARATVKVTMAGMEKGQSCGACHDGKSAFSVKEKCEACHKM